MCSGTTQPTNFFNFRKLKIAFVNFEDLKTLGIIHGFKLVL